MRLAYFINQYPKVSHSFIRREILELENQGVDITRIALRGYNDTIIDEQDLSEQLKTNYIVNTKIHIIFLTFIKSFFLHPVGFLKAMRMLITISRKSDKLIYYHFIYFIEACMLVKYMKNDGVNHVHCHFGTNSTEIALYAHLIAGISYSFTVHGPEEFDKPISISLSKKIKHSSFVISITSFCKSQLFRWCEYSEWHKIHEVHCGLDKLFIDQLLSVDNLKKDNTITCVGRLCEQKGQLLLLDACNILAKAGISFNLILAGDGEMREVIEQKIKEYNLLDRVKITGWLSSAQVKEILLLSRCMVLPSFAEGLPVVIMEAMASGTPVISTSIAGIPELIEDNKSGYLITAGSIDELVNAIKHVLTCSDSELENIKVNAQNVVRENHSINHEVSKLKTIFHRYL